VVPSNLSSEELDLLRLQFLPRVLKGNHCTAIPFLLQPSLACYSRERLLKAAASLAELLSRAAEGLAARLSTASSMNLKHIENLRPEKQCFRLLRTNLPMGSSHVAHVRVNESKAPLAMEISLMTTEPPGQANPIHDSGP